MKGHGPYVPHVLKAILDLAEPLGSSVVSIINQVETLLPCRNANDSDFPDEVYQSLMKARDDGLLLEDVRGKYKLDLKSTKSRRCLQSLIKKASSPDEMCDEEVGGDNDDDNDDNDDDFCNGHSNGNGNGHKNINGNGRKNGNGNGRKNGKGNGHKNGNGNNGYKNGQGHKNVNGNGNGNGYNDGYDDDQDDEDMEECDDNNNNGNDDNDNDDDDDDEEETETSREISRQCCCKCRPKPKKKPTKCVQKGPSKLAKPGKQTTHQQRPSKEQPKPKSYSPPPIEDEDTCDTDQQKSYSADECTFCEIPKTPKRPLKCERIIIPTQDKNIKRLRCPFCLKTAKYTEFKEVVQSDNLCDSANMLRLEQEMKEARRMRLCQKKLAMRKRAGKPYEEYRRPPPFSFSKALRDVDREEPSEKSQRTQRASTISFSQSLISKDEVPVVDRQKRTQFNTCSSASPTVSSRTYGWW